MNQIYEGKVKNEANWGMSVWRKLGAGRVFPSARSGHRGGLGFTMCCFYEGKSSATLKLWRGWGKLDEERELIGLVSPGPVAG